MFSVAVGSSSCLLFVHIAQIAFVRALRTAAVAAVDLGLHSEITLSLL